MRLKPVRFSIIIPAKNEERDLPRCLRAVRELSPSSGGFEVILVDNGSSDTTVAIAHRFGCTVFVEPGLTLSGLRNFGARASRGEILAFLDADCVPEKGWLERADAAFRDPEVGCTGSTPVAPGDGTWVERVWSSFRTRRVRSCYTSWINSSNLLVRRELFERVGGFNEKVKTCEDVDICMRLNRICRILFEPALRVVHLGEPKTVREFFLKELWRGKGTISGILSHGITLSELRSLLLPLYYLAISAALVALLAQVVPAGAASPGLLVLAVSLYLLPALLFTAWIVSRTGKYRYGAGYFFLFLLYANARSVALFRR